MKAARKVDIRKARIYLADGRVHHFGKEVFAFAVWLALPKGVRAAFRGANDTRPVYSWDRVDRQPGRDP